MRSGSPQAESAEPAARPVGTLLSVNVGMPKDVPWQGKTVFTGVFKDPVTGPRRVRRLNVDGDGQGDLAGHGGEQRAVFVYQIDSYRYWERELGRSDFVYGQFGENFTVEGLGDDEVCIGDRYRIGSAVFEVTQPRVTCYRVGHPHERPAHSRPCSSPTAAPASTSACSKRARSQAGDEIVKLASGPEQMTVAEVDALLYLPGHPRQQLLRALRIPALSPGWQASFRALLEGEPGSGNAGLTAASPPPAWPGFRRLTVTGIERESDSVDLHPPRGPRRRSRCPPRAPASTSRCGSSPTNEQRSVLRNYSLSGPPGAGYYRITVKREHGGAASGYLHTRLARRRPARDRRASRHLHPRPDPRAGAADQRRHRRDPRPRHAARARHEHSEREIWWLHGARSSRDHSFAAEARALLASLPNVRTHVCYSRPGPRRPRRPRLRQRRPSHRRRCSPSSSHRATPRHTSAGRHRSWRRSAPAWPRWGSTRSRIHTEPFGPAPGLTPGIAATPARTPHPPAGQPGNGPTIEFARSNLAVPWSSDYASLLELAEACDVPVRWSCRTGVCHNCETPLIAGEVDYSPDPVEPPADGSALICCSQPRDDVVLDL